MRSPKPPRKPDGLGKGGSTAIRIMAQVWAAPMPPRLKLVALALSDMADDDGRCWPSVETLCKKTGQSERTVQAALRELEDGKAISREKRAHRSTVYLINPANFAPTPAESAPTPPQLLPVSPAESAPRIVIESSVEPKAAGQGKPSPVAACWQIYRQGIKAAYGADYPTSAQANGQLTHVVRKLGAEPAARTIAYYLTRKKPFYVARKHALEVLVKDCATLWLELQQASGDGVDQANRCEYCERPSTGSANGWKHCREHGTLALSSIGPKQAAEKRVQP